MTHEEYLAALADNQRRGLRWRRLDVALTVAAGVTMLAVAVALIFGLTVPRAARWLGSALMLASVVPWRMYNRSIRRVQTIMNERMGGGPCPDKTYPEGCTCIRGFMFASPSCPHHGEARIRKP